MQLDSFSTACHRDLFPLGEAKMTLKQKILQCVKTNNKPVESLEL